METQWKSHSDYKQRFKNTFRFFFKYWYCLLYQISYNMHRYLIIRTGVQKNSAKNLDASATHAEHAHYAHPTCRHSYTGPINTVLLEEYSVFRFFLNSNTCSTGCPLYTLLCAL